MGIIDKFRQKKNKPERSSWRLESFREWYKTLPSDLNLKTKSLEEFGNVKVHSLDKLKKNKKSGEYLFGDKAAPEQPEKHYIFYRILKLEDLIEPLKECRFCNNPTEILILERANEDVIRDLVVCCHDHRIDGYAIIIEEEYESAKMMYDQMLRLNTKEYSDNKSENS